MLKSRPGLSFLLGALGLGCASDPGDPAADDATSAADAAPDDGDDAATAMPGDDDGSDETGPDPDPDPDPDPEPGMDAAHALLQRLPGLWVAPVMSNTSAGDFATMPMDIRPADDRSLVSRADLDAGNNLRFLFAIETHDGEDVLVFRNGGYFQNVLRDTRTRLVEHDARAGTWRFCAITGGCAYVDATFTSPDEDHLELNALVVRMQHVHWAGVRAEPRPLEEPFPFDATPGNSSDPFPAMPQLSVTLDWSDPAPAGAEAWVILTTTPCGINPVGCTPSRFIRTLVDEGATSAEFTIDQIHAGSYHAIGILDRNANLGAALLPDPGDGVTFPDQPVTVAPDPSTPSTASLLIAIDL